MPLVPTATRQQSRAQSKSTVPSAGAPFTSVKGQAAMQPSASPMANVKVRRMLRTPSPTKRTTIKQDTAQITASTQASRFNFGRSRGFPVASTSDSSGSRTGSHSVVRHPGIPNPAEDHPSPATEQLHPRSWAKYGGTDVAKQRSPQRASENGNAPSAPVPQSKSSQVSTGEKPLQSSPDGGLSSEQLPHSHAAASGKASLLSSLKTCVPDAAALKARPLDCCCFVACI